MELTSKVGKVLLEIVELSPERRKFFDWYAVQMLYWEQQYSLEEL